MKFSNKTIKIIIIFLICTAFIFNIQKIAFSKTNKKINTAKTACINLNTRWLEKYNECEGMPEDTCKKLGGVYNDCSSPCRHMKSEACIDMCLPVCSFKK